MYKVTKKNKNNNKINISIDWNSNDKGYSVLTNKRVKKFLFENLKNGNNLIQTQHNKPFSVKGKTILHLQAVPFSNWKVKPKWNEIKCSVSSSWLKVAPCFKGKRTNKMFIKYESNEHVAGLSIYLLHLLSGEVTLDDHKLFVKTLKSVMKNNLVQIHNEDVHWFHLKQYMN